MWASLRDAAANISGSRRQSEIRPPQTPDARPVERRLFGSRSSPTASDPSTQKTRKHRAYEESPYFKDQDNQSADSLDFSKKKALANSGTYNFFSSGWKPTTNTHILTYLDEILDVLQDKQFVAKKDDANDNMPVGVQALTERDMAKVDKLLTEVFKNGTDAQIEHGLSRLVEPTQDGNLRFAALEASIEGLEDEAAITRALPVLARLKASFAQSQSFRKREAERQQLKQEVKEIYGDMLLERKKEHQLRRYPLYVDEMKKIVEHDNEISQRRRR